MAILSARTLAKLAACGPALAALGVNLELSLVVLGISSGAWLSTSRSSYDETSVEADPMLNEMPSSAHFA